MNKTILIIACFAYTFIPNFGFGQALDQSGLELLARKADTILQQSVDYKENHGVSAAIYYKGAMIWSGGAGWMDINKTKPAKGDMIARTASITKSMTAVAILQLVEAGKIDLDVPIQTYIPNFPKKKEGTITTRHLLNQTSGIANYKSMKDGFSTETFTMEEAVDRFKDRKLVGKPGQVYQYATYNYMVLGLIIEKVSGQKYEDFLYTNVWKPAQMEDTYLEHKAKPSDRKSDLFVAENSQTTADLQTNLSMKAAGGGVQSSAIDLGKFALAMLDNQLVQAATFTKMLENPGVRKNGTPYGMGFKLYQDGPYGKVIGHNGAQAGCATEWMVFLDQDLVVSVLSNTRNGNATLIAQQLAKIVLSEEQRAKAIPSTVKLKPAQIDAITGKYAFNKKNVIEIYFKDGQFYSDLNQFKGLKLYAASPSKLYYRSMDAQFEFDLNTDGQVEKTTYYQNGQAMNPNKVK
ncbi:MAG: serine hydrolase domain-containing protein [Bacteroidota bacterium]